MEEIKNNKDLTISFMFPVTSGIMGGVQMLIINLIKYISIEKHRKVRLYDYSFGLIRQTLVEMKIENYEFIPLDDSKWHIPNKGNEIFILTNGVWLTYPYFLKNKENVHILLWDVFYPYWETLGTLKGIKIPNFKKQKAMDLLSKNNGVVFMEKNGFESFHKLGYPVNEKMIVPIPVNCDHNLYAEKHTFDNETLRLGYIGRSTEWKIYPLKKLVEDLIKTEIKVKVFIYTDNNLKYANYLPVNSNIEYIYKIGYYEKKLEDSILENNIDIGYAMGTSALEFGRIGVPTILADFSNNEFPFDYKYRFLFDSDVGDLGKDIRDINDKEKRYRLKEIINNIDLPEFSSKTFEYTKENHSIERVFNKLNYAIDQNNLRLEFLNLYPFCLSKLRYIVRRTIKQNDKFFGWGFK